MSRAAQIRALAAERCSEAEIALGLAASLAQVREVLVADARFQGRPHSQRRIARAFNRWCSQRFDAPSIGGRGQ